MYVHCPRQKPNAQPWETFRTCQNLSVTVEHPPWRGDYDAIHVLYMSFSWVNWTSHLLFLPDGVWRCVQM